MHVNVCLPLNSEEPLAQHRDRAEARLNAARAEYHQTQLINVARIVTAALPEAASIDLARHLFDFQNEMWLEAIHAADGTLLWHDHQALDPLAEFHYANGATWKQAAEVIAETVGQALAGAEITDVADQRPDWSRPNSSGPIELFRVTLPDRRVVEHHTTTPPGPDEPRVEVVTNRDPDSATEVHVFVDGVPILAELTDVDPGRGWVLSDWRALAAEHAADASPAAAELITQLFRQGESSEFVTA
ncbi:hypothetical protein [Saccharomonospora saliphila]|uniref:hypothetical protein n=1 Tax=Saccharomonospora saliphila TaxID=369829 RepID=UPI00036107D7|nr:hypothetical protein [Saccharomonospora saliphila]